jgi:hypothetical protein
MFQAINPMIIKIKPTGFEIQKTGAKCSIAVAIFSLRALQYYRIKNSLH